MLKIKDNVDLKELEKYGFEYEEDWDDSGKVCYYKNWDLWLFIEPCDAEDYRCFLDFDCGFGMKSVDILYDLIKADLVEKVEQ